MSHRDRLTHLLSLTAGGPKAPPPGVHQWSKKNEGAEDDLSKRLNALKEFMQDTQTKIV